MIVSQGATPTSMVFVYQHKGGNTHASLLVHVIDYVSAQVELCDSSSDSMQIMLPHVLSLHVKKNDMMPFDLPRHVAR